MVHRPSGLELLCQVCIVELIIGDLCLQLPCYLLVAEVFLVVVFLLHEAAEVRWIQIRAQLLHHFLQGRQVLMLAHIVAEAHVVLHLGVVLTHELLHTIGHVVLSLLLNGVLVLLQLASEQVRLLVLEKHTLLLSLFNRCETLHILLVDAPVVDTVRVGEPDVVAVVPDKLRLHLEYLDLAHLLQVVAHLEALHPGVALELATPQQRLLVLEPELLVADLSRRRFIICLVEWRFELDCDVVWSGLLRGTHARLDVVDHLGGVVAVGLAQLVGQLGDASVGEGLQLLEIASVEVVSCALRSAVIGVLLEVLESDPSEPVITVLVLRIARLLLRHHVLDLASLALAASALLPSPIFLLR